MKWSLLLLLVVGCSGMSAGVSDVGGTWKGQWTSPRGLSGGASVTLEQHGSSVHGSFTMQGSPCLTGGSVDGSFDGNQLVAHLVSGSSKIDVTLTHTTEDRFDGDYVAVMAGLCSGDKGAVTLSR